MRASSGEHYVALDHVRALAAFAVFAWHFMHGFAGQPIPFGYVPDFFPFAVLEEGHTGVALFMALSGYLFAKLLDGKKVSYRAFYWNRFVRLAPLLIVVLFFLGVARFVRGQDLASYVVSLAVGVILPTWPSGAWTLAIEMHFYLLLPLLLSATRRSALPIVLVLVCALALRCMVYLATGEIQGFSYWTIVGRIDQFLFGMLAFQYRGFIRDRHWIAVGVAIGFAALFWVFDAAGGFYGTGKSPLWILLPSVEGLSYAVLIAYYDSSYAPPDKGLSRFVALIGAYSYSIYLLHFYFVFALAGFIHTHVMDLSRFYVACAWSLVGFLLMVPIAYFSFRVIESPFLALRKRYY